MNRYISICVCLGLLSMGAVRVCAARQNLSVNSSVFGFRSDSSSQKKQHKKSVGGEDRENTAQISGVVKLEDGKPVPNAEVMLTDKITEETQTTHTDQTGRYSFRHLFSGEYAIVARISSQPEIGGNTHAKVAAKKSAASTGAQPKAEETGEAVSLDSNDKLVRNLIIHR